MIVRKLTLAQFATALMCSNKKHPLVSHEAILSKAQVLSESRSFLSRFRGEASREYSAMVSGWCGEETRLPEVCLRQPRHFDAESPLIDGHVLDSVIG
jgi:hypothetical protein